MIDNMVYSGCLEIFISGIALGFVLGFIAWGLGFGVYGMIKLFKLA